ncbi:polysaccharide biosynthesis tyrosine autokinase [Tropicibacter oceani]|uniref:non-specific protein-tyrosine kinase n=1 Tax=Tropicibacter oceani TaxID=3058420 RepID=A0ABY8QIL2_9RHOB|nr:polysaccharide biosynthesis tyrosine autokinase [Tropicibacter oceani]WGW04477.1 polysaccharide biosynthesis tyrosine autokinase [Tropicibacter oceani]
MSSEENGQSGRDSIDLVEVLRIFWRGKWLIAIFATGFALLVGYYAFNVAQPQYATSVRLALEVRSQQVVDLESVVSGVSTEQAAINTELEVITSRGLLEKLVQDLNLTEDPEFNVSLQDDSGLSVSKIKVFIKDLFGVGGPKDLEPSDEDTLLAVTEAISGSITANAQRNTYLLEIRVSTGDPKKSALIANRLAQIYLDDQIAIKFAATEYAVNWLSERVQDLELELKQKEDTIRELRAETDLISLEALEAINVRSKDIRERLADAEIAVTAAQARFEDLSLLAESDDLAAIEAKLNMPALRPLLRDAQRGDAQALRSFRAMVTAAVDQARDNLDRATSQRDSLETSYRRIQSEIDEQNTDLLKLNQLVREADATRVLYETFLARLKETSVQIGLQQADSRILSEAIPGRLVAPRKTRMIAIGIILGGLLGAALSLLMDLRKNGFRTAEDLEKTTGYTSLAQIPQMPIKDRSGLVTFLRQNPTSAAAEAIRNLRTSVLMSNMASPPQIIMSTSSIPGEGKTTQAIALAQNLSGMNKKVLLIEGDIRRNTLSQYFGKESPAGLVAVVMGDASIEEAVMKDDLLGADILMGGKSEMNAADLFSTEMFRQFLLNIRNVYDYVIIDTPPVLVVPDARIIGPLVDAIIYSVHWDHTQKIQVKNGLRELSSVGVHVTGLVLSRVDPKGMKRYGYGGRYGAYSGYGNAYYDT